VITNFDERFDFGLLVKHDNVFTHNGKRSLISNGLTFTYCAKLENWFSVANEVFKDRYFHGINASFRTRLCSRSHPFFRDGDGDRL
jgi:hypothetical protein